MNVISQGSVLGPALFSIFVNTKDHNTECTLRKFAVNIKLCGAADIKEGRDAIQMDPDTLKKLKWNLMNLMRFNKTKCKILHLG